MEAVFFAAGLLVVFEAVVLAFVAAALVAGFFAAAVRAPDDLVGVVAFGAAVSGVATASSAFAAAAASRAVLLSAARALPAAVCAPLALSALEAAIRALAAFWAAALPVVLTMRPPEATVVPPSAALTLRVRRDLRRAAAFGWMAPTLAARSSALRASMRACAGSIPSVGWVAAVSAFAT